MYHIFIYYISHLQDLVNLFLAPNHKMCRGSRGLPPSCRGAGMLPQASLLYLNNMDIRQLIVRLPGDDIGKQGDIRILQPLGRGGDGDQHRLCDSLLYVSGIRMPQAGRRLLKRVFQGQLETGYGNAAFGL